MRLLDFHTIVSTAWMAYEPQRQIQEIIDISAQVSTNHVYKIIFTSSPDVVAKVSYFGTYEHFQEDHRIINAMARKLPPPFNHFLAHGLRRDEKVFTYRFQEASLDIWVVFYQEIEIRQSLPKKLNLDQVQNLGEEMASFHKACVSLEGRLPRSSKTLESDILHLLAITQTHKGKSAFGTHIPLIRQHCQIFLKQCEQLRYTELQKIPLFVDWNIGNFSLDEQNHLFSRWDYDWFRVSNRVLDFYFMSRVVSEGGDQTVFSYWVDPMMDERFLVFLKAYHQVYPLSLKEIMFMKEAYRFFILHYVINFGRHFFHTVYAQRLQQEAYAHYLPDLDQKWQVEPIRKALGI